MISILDFEVLTAILLAYMLADGLIVLLRAKKGGKPDFKREALKLCLFLYCILLLRLTEFQHVKFYGYPQAKAIVNFIPFRVIAREIIYILKYGLNQRTDDINLFGNVLFFLPLGLLASAVWPCLRRWWKCLLMGFLVSFAIESAQYVLTNMGFINRMADIDDVILNAAGTLAGYGLFVIVRSFLRKSLVARSDTGTE